MGLSNAWNAFANYGRKPRDSFQRPRSTRSWAALFYAKNSPAAVFCCREHLAVARIFSTDNLATESHFLMSARNRLSIF